LLYSDINIRVLKERIFLFLRMRSLNLRDF
jgi:hypothetical protein